MNYRDLIDIPELPDWVPWDKRFSHPEVSATSPDPPRESRKGRGRPTKEPQPVELLVHVGGLKCPGTWERKGRNKRGDMRVRCSNCGALRIVNS